MHRAQTPLVHTKPVVAVLQSVLSQQEPSEHWPAQQRPPRPHWRASTQLPHLCVVVEQTWPPEQSARVQQVALA
jgi:hypothetical protein